MTVAEYIERFPKPVQRKLQDLRRTIKKLVPDATEVISYGIPTFKLEKNLVHYAAYAHHIGFYPGAAVMAAFKKDLKGYKFAKGSVQFPLDEPLPLALVKKIVRFRLDSLG